MQLHSCPSFSKEESCNSHTLEARPAIKSPCGQRCILESDQVALSSINAPGESLYVERRITLILSAEAAPAASSGSDLAQEPGGETQSPSGLADAEYLGDQAAAALMEVVRHLLFSSPLLAVEGLEMEPVALNPCFDPLRTEDHLKDLAAVVLTAECLSVDPEDYLVSPQAQEATARAWHVLGSEARGEGGHVGTLVIRTPPAVSSSPVLLKDAVQTSLLPHVQTRWQSTFPGQPTPTLLVLGGESELIPRLDRGFGLNGAAFLALGSFENTKSTRYARTAFRGMSLEHMELVDRGQARCVMLVRYELPHYSFHDWAWQQALDSAIQDARTCERAGF